MNTNNLIYKEQEVNEKKYTPKICNIYYIDKEQGEMSIPTRTDEITFSENFLKNKNDFFSNETILNIEGIEIIEPGDLLKVVNNLSCVTSLLNMTDFTELPFSCSKNIDCIGEYRDFIESLMIILSTAKKEIEQHWNYLECTTDFTPNDAA